MGIMFQKRKMPNKDNGFSIKRKLRVMKHEYIKFCIAQSLGNGSFISESERKRFYSSCHCHSVTVWTICCIANEVKCEVSKDDTELCFCEKCPEVKLNSKLDKTITRDQKGTK